MTYQYHGYGGSHEGQGAVSQLEGPGSSASVQGAYYGSYAYESQRGGIYSSEYIYNTNDFVSHTSYTYSGPQYGYKFDSTYDDYTSHTTNSPYTDPTYGYHYSPYSAYGYITHSINTFYGVYQYSGGNEYFDLTTRVSSETSNGYAFYTYIHDTFERTDGQFDTGSGYQYLLKSVTDPYGYTSSSYYATHS